MSAERGERRPPFERFGAGGQAGPVVIAVPHAGRDYPPEALAASRGGERILSLLEDRHADVLTQGLIEAGHCVFVARCPRALIDLNRDEREMDAGSVARLPAGFATLASAKLRGGLGLLPRSLARHGELWRERPDFAVVVDRIARVHRPYHAALAEALAAARMRNGAAVLLDLHSMPTMRAFGDQSPPQMVVGDRFGQSASGEVSDFVASFLRNAGYRVATNAPYAGGHTLDRHGRPRAGQHAIQLEIDRALYLKAEPDGAGRPGPGVGPLAGQLVSLVEALGAAFGGSSASLAAE